MFNSILEDIKQVFRSGNMLSRIIMVNVFVFLVLLILGAFSPSLGHYLGSKLSIVSSPGDLVMQFWGVLTHMFTHERVFHLFWNMILLYWFGSIVGDLLNDTRILPLYILGGLAGALAFLIWGQFIVGGASAIGASAAVMCMVMVAATLAPDYTMHLLLIGPVKIKWIAAVLLVFDLAGIRDGDNSGGHWGHLGGAAFGLAYVYFLRQGKDLTEPIQSLFGTFQNINSPRKRKTPRSTFTVYKNDTAKKSSPQSNKGFTQQAELDRILDKINVKGYDQLTTEEKDFLYKASKKK